MGGRGGGFRGGGRGGPPRGRGGGAPRGRGGGGRGFKKSGPDDPRISSEVQIFIEGLPPNTQIPELKNFFSGAGEIKMDRLTKQPRIWLYHDKGSQQDCHIDSKLFIKVKFKILIFKIVMLPEVFCLNYVTKYLFMFLLSF